MEAEANEQPAGFIDSAQDQLFSTRGVKIVLALATLLVVGAGLLFAAVEDQYNARDGLWFSLQTVTTVGYGDVVPTTTTGRLVGAVLMIVGIGMFSLITAGAAQHFLRRRLGMTVPAAEQAIRLRELADEQRALREEIQALRRTLEGAGTDAGR